MFIVHVFWFFLIWPTDGINKPLAAMKECKVKYSMEPRLLTVDSGIDVGQGINIRPGKFDKKNKHRVCISISIFHKNDFSGL